MRSVKYTSSSHHDLFFKIVLLQCFASAGKFLSPPLAMHHFTLTNLKVKLAAFTVYTDKCIALVSLSYACCEIYVWSGSLIPLFRFVVSFFLLTYFLNRPCVYCSILLLILFISSCYWSDHCFFDIHSNWFEPRHLSSTLPNPLPQIDISQNHETETEAFLATAIADTGLALAGAAAEELRRRIGPKSEWTGIGVEWIRSWLGAREWRVPCLDVYIRL